MEFKLNKIYFYLFLAGILSFLGSCTNKEQDSHSNITQTEGIEEEHGDENLVTLSDLQIKTVGIELGTLEQKQLSATIKANGFLRVPNSHKANATSLFGGIVKSLNVEIGDYVRKGQAIATISNVEFIQVQEEYLSIKSKIEYATQELNRQKELSEGNVGAARNLQSATSELNTLRTRRASLQQQIQMMGINPASLSNSNLKTSVIVKSPISGTVSNVFSNIGSYVDVSSPIAELIENSALHLDLEVFEKDLSYIKTGQTIDFVVTNSPGKTYKAEVYKIGSSFSNAGKTIAIHSKVIGDKTGLFDGMNITGLVNLDGVLSTAVPNDAIVNSENKNYIFLVQNPEEKDGNDKEFKKLEVILGATELGYTAITPVQEIPVGTPIVVKGAFFVNAKMIDTDGEHAH